MQLELSEIAILTLAGAASLLSFTYPVFAGELLLCAGAGLAVVALYCDQRDRKLEL